MTRRSYLTRHLSLYDIVCEVERLISRLASHDNKERRAMPGTSRATNPKGVQITFDEQSHIYSSVVNGLQVKYTSGT